jgi:hypothetical protein
MVVSNQVNPVERTLSINVIDGEGGKNAGFDIYGYDCF